MRQFVEAWRDRPKLSALLRELPWTQHLVVLGQSKRPEEQEFYLRRCIGQLPDKDLLQAKLHELYQRTLDDQTPASPAQESTARTRKERSHH